MEVNYICSACQELCFVGIIPSRSVERPEVGFAWNLIQRVRRNTAANDAQTIANYSNPAFILDRWVPVLSK